MLPLKPFENLHTKVAILVLFKQILGKFCFNFLPLILSVTPNMMHFVRTFSIMRAQGLRLLLLKRFEIMEKLYSSTAWLKMIGGGDASPHPPLNPPLVITSADVQFSAQNRVKSKKKGHHVHRP